ncbi:MAG: hypothetical protein QHJ73_09225 [Armatimonadota bacterium]|nr:hypothetical protein [Armatimonadota bacterium]
MSDQGAGERGAGERRWSIAALVLACMSVVFSLSMGPRFYSREREVGELRASLDALRQEVTAMRQELSRTRVELKEEREKGQSASAAQGDVEVTTESQTADVREIQSRLSILDARQARLYERFNRLVQDLKSSNVDLGVSDRGL